jgi:hypothetical protein
MKAGNNVTKLTMNVVTRHIITITEKVFMLRIPALLPVNIAINS